jgi:Lon protease-like protein
VSAESLPLFPLNTVLFPGVGLPLHVFEERYRILVGELVEQTGPRRFGVVAIRQGLEVGEYEEPVLHEVGCVAEIRRVHRHDDGRYDVVTFGGPRFRLLGTDDARPYLRGSVEYLPEDPGDDAPGRAAVVATAFGAYCRAVALARDEEVAEPALPLTDPVLTSYVVAAAMRLDLPEKQGLLALPDATARLRVETSLLRRETALLGAMPDEVPTEGPFSLN